MYPKRAAALAHGVIQVRGRRVVGKQEFRESKRIHMRNSDKTLFKIVGESWKDAFPALRPIHLKEIPQRPRGSNFLCDRYFQERGLVYFFSIGFAPKRPGQFTLSVTISDTQERSIFTGGGADELRVGKLGTYRIAAFMKRQDWWWCLSDVEKEADDFMVSLGGGPIYAGRKLPHRWRANSYAVPLEQIVREGVLDLNAQIREYVLPQLNLVLD